VSPYESRRYPGLRLPLNGLSKISSQRRGLPFLVCRFGRNGYNRKIDFMLCAINTDVAHMWSMKGTCFSLYIRKVLNAPPFISNGMPVASNGGHRKFMSLTREAPRSWLIGHKNPLRARTSTSFFSSLTFSWRHPGRLFLCRDSSQARSKKRHHP